MASAGAGTGPDQHLVRPAGGDDLVHKGVDGRTPAIDDALSADLDHCCVRQDSEVFGCPRGRLKLRIGQRSLHEERLEFRRHFGHEILPLFEWIDGSPLVEIAVTTHTPWLHALRFIYEKGHPSP